jgi:hypothetical protein
MRGLGHSSGKRSNDSGRDCFISQDLHYPSCMVNFYDNYISRPDIRSAIATQALTMPA